MATVTPRRPDRGLQLAALGLAVLIAVGLGDAGLGIPADVICRAD